MLPTATLPAVATGTVTTEPTQKNGAQPAENAEFEAILATTTATATAQADSLPGAIGGIDPDQAAGAELPEGGKELPEAAASGNEAVVAVPILALLPLPAAATSPAAPLQPALDQPPPPAAPPLQQGPLKPLPRLAPGKSDQQSTLPLPPQVPQIAASVLSPTTLSPATLPPVTLSRDGPRQAPPPRVAATLRLLAEAAPDKAAALPGEAVLGATGAAPQPQSFAFLSAPTAAPSSGPPSTAATVQGPHDFAQLIDRLVAARESTQPQAATLALAHADFGRIELRFASDSTGLSVAMASADPDFARAVQAAVPPASASTDSSAAQGRQPGQQGQSGAQAEAFAGQNHGQHTARREPQNRLVAANPGVFRPDPTAGQQGIFA